MKNNFLAAFFLSGLLFCGCNSSTEEQSQTQSADSIAAPATENIAMPEAPAITTPESQNATMQQPAQQPSASGTNPNAGATGMNPAHGEPGHRCDISVGAPLNSPPGSTPATPPTSAVTPVMPQSSTTIQSMPPTQNNINTNVQPSAPPTTTAPGMNPPHGQPGHDCAIAVGAPLKK